MVIQTGWYVTDFGESGADASNGAFTVGGDGVLRVGKGQKSYRFSQVFPQFSTKQSVFEEFMRAHLIEGTRKSRGSCTVICGERSESQRLEMLFGKVPLNNKRANYSDGLAIRLYRDLPTLGADAHVRFSLACLKEKGTHAVDLLKNLGTASSVSSTASVSSHLSEAAPTTQLNCKLMTVSTVASFTSLLNKVLQSPSFIRLSQSLSLLLTFSVIVNGRESTISILDVSSPHMDSFDLLSLIPQIRSSVMVNAAVPEFLQLSVKSAESIGVLVMHPNTLSSGLEGYLEGLASCGNTSPLSPSGRLSPTHLTGRAGSPERKWMSPTSPGSPVRSDPQVSVSRSRVGRLAGGSATAIIDNYSSIQQLNFSERDNYEREIEKLTHQLRDQERRAEQLAQREITARGVEMEDVENRMRTMEIQITKSHEVQMTSERNAHRRALADLEQEFMRKESDNDRQLSQLQENILSLNTQLDHKSQEINHIKSTIPEVRREEAARLNEDWERSMEATDHDIQKLQKTLNDHTHALESSEQDNEELREALRAAQETLEKSKIKTIEDRSHLETEMEAERSGIRGELSMAQADALKATRLLEAKELEIQGLSRLTHEMEEIRSRNGELERLLRESQHYNKTKQLKREVDTCNEILEGLRLILVPTWCQDWQRLGRIKDLKEHLIARGEDMSQKVRDFESLERNQRVREVALVGEHENAIAKMTEQSRRAALLEARSSEAEQEMLILRSDYQGSKSEQSELRRIVESISMILMEPSPGLTEHWIASPEIESWLVNALRQVRSERDRYRDSEVDKSHHLQELQVRFAQLQAENDTVNQNIKEMTNQIIGCQIEPFEEHMSVIRSPISTSVDVIPQPVEVSPVVTAPPLAVPSQYRPLLMMSPSVPQAVKPHPLIHSIGVLPVPVQTTPRHTTRHIFPTSPSVSSVMR